jgi:hypothetical protein
VAIGLDHVGIIGADLDAIAREFSELGFALTPPATHASGRTANRCAMLRMGGYLELIATVPGQTSATLDRFLAHGPGAHIIALEVGDESAALARLARAGITNADLMVTERDAAPAGEQARFAVVMPPDQPEGRILLIRHLTRDVLWRPNNTVHPNGAVGLTEAVFATDAPAETITRLSRLSGCPAEPDPLGGYRIPFGGSRIRILPRAVAAALFGGAIGPLALAGLTIATEGGGERVVHAGGVAIRYVGREPDRP